MKFKAILVYKSGSMTARAVTQRNSFWGKKEKKKRIKFKTKRKELY